MQSSDAWQTWRDWERWRELLAGDPDEDLASVLAHVRLHRQEEARAACARDPLTRTFIDLGLHLLYEHHINRGSAAQSQGKRLFRDLGPTDLANHAATVIRNAEAKQLNRDRWAGTWSHKSAYVQDLIAYLYRPGPYLRRVREMRTPLLALVDTLPLAKTIRAGAEAELRSVLDNPIIALQTFVCAALPTDPTIRTYVRRLEKESLTLWADLYATAFPRYGLQLRDGMRWYDIAELFTTAAEGAQFRTRAREDVPRLSDGVDVLSASLLAMLPSLFTIDSHNIEHIELENLTARPDPGSPDGN